MKGNGMLKSLRKLFVSLFFGNWKRTGITSAIGGFMLADRFPEQFGQIYASCLAIALTIFGIRVMFHPYWPIKAFSSKKKKD